MFGDVQTLSHYYVSDALDVTCKVVMILSHKSLVVAVMEQCLSM